MRLNSISLINFGVFRGRHQISLKTSPEKPIILIGGKNGAGKSTILEAVYLCLYGTQSAGGRATKDQYTHYLEQHIHSSPSLLVQPTFASVSIEFSYADLGRVHDYEVTRSWGRTSTGKTADRLDVKRDGVSMGDLGTEQWQDFIRELIPIGVSNLFFFDGEKIQHLAEDSTDQVELANSIKALLGVNLVDRLQADLAIFQSRLARAKGDTGTAPAIEAIERELASAQAVLVERESLRSRLHESLRILGAQITQLDQAIAAEGGGYAKRRDSLVRRREESRAKIATAENSIRQLCAGLLPFSLASGILADLRAQLRAEQTAQATAAGLTLAASLRSQFSDILLKDPQIARRGAKISDRILAALDSAIAQVNSASKQCDIVHSLSPSVSQQILHWIDLALGEIPRSAHAIGRDLEISYRDLQKAEAELKRVPADEVLKPLLDQMNTANQEMGSVTKQLSTVDEEIRAAEARVSEVQRRRDLEGARIRQQSASQEQLLLIPRLNSALGEFTSGLIVERVRQLEHELAHCFNVLLRKTDSVRRVSISPSTFAVTLYDSADAPLSKQALSAGEKQIYAIAVLWALAKVSRRPLPLIIDTPLGRLDSDHRRLLVDGYFPAASHQVILLSTDTEIDHVYFEALKPYVAKAYRLEFDMVERCTVPQSGYFEAATCEAN